MSKNYAFPDGLDLFPQIRDRSALRDYLFSSINNIGPFKEDVVKYSRLKTIKRTIETRKWYIGNPKSMNDYKEVADFPHANWDRIFHSSFIANSGENIAMWTLYGRPWSDGVSITIKNDDFKRWIKESSTLYYYDGAEYRELSEAQLCFVRVAYTNELSKEKAEESILSCCGQRNRYINNIFNIESDEPGWYYDPSMFAGAVKDIAWSYENEVRIRCDVSGNNVPNAVFIDVPDYIIHNMIITAGPMFYGNLENRLSAQYDDHFRLKYSVFRHHLQGMPCSEYLYLANSDTTCCQEKESLVKAQSDTPIADSITLRHFTGNGIFRFPERGSFAIGKGEHLFQISWHRRENDVIIEQQSGKVTFFSSIPPERMLCYYHFSLSPATVLDDQTVIIKNKYGRVAAIRICPENEKDKNEIYEMEYKIYMEPTIEIFKADEYSKKLEDISSTPIQDPNDPLCGTWWDINSKRCHMSIGKAEDKYCVVIQWASSACINTEWTMSGIWNPDWNGMLCTDEKCVTTSFFEETQTVQVTTEYHNGSSKLIMVNGEILWEDAAKATGNRCRFVKDLT